MAKTKNKETWYRIENRDYGPDHVYLYGIIGGYEITAADFVREINRLEASDIVLHIDSGGGVAFEGITIYNAVREHSANVEVHIDGNASSAASIIAMAGDKVFMNRGSQMMIHDGRLFMEGDAVELREAADLLDSVSDGIAEIYAARTGLKSSHWRELMKATTRYNAEQAVEAKLADGLVDDEATSGAQARDGVVAINKWVIPEIKSPVAVVESKPAAFDPELFRKQLKGEK